MGILMELQTGKILECSKHISDRLNNGALKSGDPLAVRKANVAAKKSALHRRACDMSDRPSGTCHDTSSSSDSHTTPTLEESQDDVTVNRKEPNASLMSTGSTLGAVRPDSATHMEQTVQDLMARHGVRRNSTGSIPSVPDENVLSAGALPPKTTSPDVKDTPTLQPCRATNGPIHTAGHPPKLEAPIARSTTGNDVDYSQSDLPDGVPKSHSASSFVDQIAAVNELSRRAYGLTTSIRTEPLPTTVHVHTIKPTRLLRNADPPSSSTDKLRNQLLPGFLRRNSVPSRHQAVAHQVGHEIVMREHPSNQLMGGLVGFRKDKEGEKDETLNRLNELTPFALCGFGFFQTRIGTWTYNKERKATTVRQAFAEKGRFWELGLREPKGNRVSTDCAALNWGSPTDGKLPDDALLLGDCAQWTQDSYDLFITDGEKLEARDKQPSGLDRFARAAKQNILIFALRYGNQNKPERSEALSAMETLRDAHPELFTAPMMVQTWEAMNFNDISEIKECARRAIRTLADSIGEIDLRRRALTPSPSGKPLWGYPSTWLMTNEAGFRQSTVIPKLGEKVSSATWKTVLPPPYAQSQSWRRMPTRHIHGGESPIDIGSMG